METKTTIVSISQEDLVNLLSNALYGSSMFDADYNAVDYNKLADKNEHDSFEDKLAKILLNGGSIIITDMYAVDKDNFYGTLPHKWYPMLGKMDYSVTLDDIKKGLQMCLDGTFKKNDGYSTEVSYIRKCMSNLINESGDLDLCEAQNLLQVIVFGMMVYS